MGQYWGAGADYSTVETIEELTGWLLLNAWGLSWITSLVSSMGDMGAKAVEEKPI